MNAPRVFLMAICALPLAVSTVSAEDSGPSKSSVTKLNGTKLFGEVEIVDDYTIRVSNDSGIMKIPIALLGEKDFKKFSSNKDRSQDGRLWSERKNALESENQQDAKSPQADPSKKDSKTPPVRRRI